MNLTGLRLRSFLRFVATNPTSSEEVKNYQEVQLRRIVNYAYYKNQFYRNRFDRASIKPEDICTLEDLEKIPPVTKEELRKSDFKSLLSQDYQAHRVLNFWTTGSTGVPLHIVKSRLENWMILLVRLRGMRRLGYRPSQKVLRIGLDRPIPNLFKLFSKVGLFRSAAIPMTLSPSELADKVISYKPDVLIGLPSTLGLVAQEIEDRNETLRVGCTLSGGELLTPGLRTQIEGVFGRVLNSYASVEVQHPIALECVDKSNMHSFPQGVILEVLSSDDKPAENCELGEVVLTSLLSFSMPIIRYRMGDLAEIGASNCNCRLEGVTIREIQGRRSDYFILPGGEPILAIQAAHKIQVTADWILQYELVQHSLTEIRLNIVPINKPSEDQMGRLIEVVEHCFEDKIPVTVNLVRAIEPGAGGKYRIIRTLLGSPYDSNP